MAKVHTTINVDKDLWQNWQKFCIDKTGTAKGSSHLLEYAMKEYMEAHP